MHCHHFCGCRFVVFSFIFTQFIVFEPSRAEAPPGTSRRKHHPNHTAINHKLFPRRNSMVAFVASSRTSFFLFKPTPFYIVYYCSKRCLLGLPAARESSGYGGCKGGGRGGAAFPLRLCCWCCATSGFYGFTVSSFASCSDSKSSSRIIRNAPARNNGYGYEWNNVQEYRYPNTPLPTAHST